MSSNIKRELILDGLDCANCAAKIEKKSNEINGINLASMNFITKTLTLNISDSAGDMESILSQVNSIINKLEPDVVVREKTISKAEKKKQADNIHDENEHSHGEGENNKKELIRLIIGAAIFGTAIVFKFSTAIEFTLYFISYVLVGGEVLLRAFRNILRGQVFDENFLMSIATIGAFSIGDYPEGVAVMLFYQVGEFIQGIAVNRSRKSIASLMDIRPDYANLKVGYELKKVSPDDNESSKCW